MAAEKRYRSVFVGLALVCALSALWLQSYDKNEPGNLQAQALFRNHLLGNVLPLEALLVKTASPDIRQLFGGSLSLSKVDSDPTLVKVSLEITRPQEAETQMALVQEKLSLIASDIVTSEARETARNLREVEQPQQNPPKKKKRAESRKPGLNERERKTVLRLRLETQDLKRFVTGGPEPVWLLSRLDRELYQRPEAELSRARAELADLKSAYRRDAGRVKRKEEEVARLAQSLTQNKIHLAKILLQSQLEELGVLERKAVSVLKENVAVAERAERAPKDDDGLGSANWAEKSERATKDKNDRALESTNWTENVADILEQDSKARAESARFQRQGEITIIQPESKLYWTRLALWLSAAVFLLMGLFKPDGSSQSAPVNSVPALSEFDFMMRQQKAHGATGGAGPILEAEPHLAEFLATVKDAQGTRARRYLVLGTSQGDSRPVLTARLAKTLSANGEKVRLVDLDLNRKLLSSKLGNHNTAGVTDLLASRSVPPEEFLAPLTGTRIEFAPAGISRVSDISAENAETLSQLLRPRPDGTLLVDAGFDSPVKLALRHVDAVICVTSVDNRWSEEQQRVLLDIKEANKPIWGLFQQEYGA